MYSRKTFQWMFNEVQDNEKQFLQLFLQIFFLSSHLKWMKRQLSQSKQYLTRGITGYLYSNIKNLQITTVWQTWKHKTCVLIKIHVKKILDLPWSPIVFNPTKYLLLITNLPAMFWTQLTLCYSKLTSKFHSLMLFQQS